MEVPAGLSPYPYTWSNSWAVFHEGRSIRIDDASCFVTKRNRQGDDTPAFEDTNPNLRYDVSIFQIEGLKDGDVFVRIEADGTRREFTDNGPHFIWTGQNGPAKSFVVGKGRGYVLFRGLQQP